MILMGYSHASRDLKDRHDRYGGVSCRYGDYHIPARQYGAGVDLSGYLRQAGWPTGFSSSQSSYSLNHDSYRLREMQGGANRILQYDRNFAKQFKGYSAKKLESRLYLN